MSKTVSLGLLMLLASIIAITPLAIDMYLPAMPVMADEFRHRYWSYPAIFEHISGRLRGRDAAVWPCWLMLLAVVLWL